ncbi:MAG: DUF5615 family PIN-like protein [Candidatus Aenigmarchaeota archaeon]|nr:DUF5615 family PIN-like protein [Candidatus Aenigmarchaeota archaeon]
MSLSVSHSQLKFLRDENVKKRLEAFLKQRGFDIISKPKGLSNGKIAEFSKSEQRVLITNDWHFTDSSKFPKDKIFSVIWLRIPQDKPDALLESFSVLLKDKSKVEDFEGFLIELREGGEFKSSPIKSSKFVRFTK